jgi:signal transduction histidine kinase
VPSVKHMTTIATAAPDTTAARMSTVVRQLGIDTRYAVLGLPLAVVSLSILIAGFAAGVALVVVFIGLPILAGTLYVARGIADIERLALASVLRRGRARPHYRRADPQVGWLRRLVTPLTQLQSWLDLAHGVLKLPFAIFSFVLVLTWWALAVGGTLYVFYDWAIPNPPDNVGLHELLGMPDTAASRIAFNTAIGLFCLLTVPLVARGCAVLQAGFARAMLVGVAEMRDRITVLEEQRAAAVSAEAIALRRLERDIHDGPQQRLVRLAMDLGRAQQQLDSDPTAARETLQEALAQTRETLAELRALSRGIAPPILVDRGLPSALAALAGRSTVPVELAVDPALGTAEGRLAPAVENAAYFVVAEALTNVAKHSRATECLLTVARGGYTAGVGAFGPRRQRLGIVVADDGVGGAHLAKGHGLAGLADRVRALGGTLTVTSPVGGPTEIRADLPC